MVQRRITTNLVYLLGVVVSCGLYAPSFSMDNRLKRSDKNYVSPTKKIIEAADEAKQDNLTAIKSMVYRAEKDLRLCPLDLDIDIADSWVNRASTNLVPPMQSSNQYELNLFYDFGGGNKYQQASNGRKKISENKANFSKQEEDLQQKKDKNKQKQRRKEEEKVAYQEKTAIILQARNAKLEEALNFELMIESPKGKSNTNGKKRMKVSTKKISSTQPLHVSSIQSRDCISVNFTDLNNDIQDSTSIESTSHMIITNKNGINSTLTRSQPYLPAAIENHDNAKRANQKDLTAIKGDIKRTQKKELKIKKLSYSFLEDSSSE